MYKTEDDKLRSPLMNFPEVMRYLKVSRSTVYRLIWSGKLPSHKVGNNFRFYRRDVIACIEGQAPSKETTHVEAPASVLRQTVRNL